MPLDDTCETACGKLLYFRTHHGWGWGRTPSGEDEIPWQSRSHSRPEDVPEPFHARLAELLRHDGRIFAGVARIEEPMSPYQRQWIAFCGRDAHRTGMNLVADFSTRIASYNFGIGLDKPHVTMDSEVPIPYWMTFQNRHWLHGFGSVGESKAAVEEFARDPKYYRWRSTEAGERVYEVMHARMKASKVPEWLPATPPDRS